MDKHLFSPEGRGDPDTLFSRVKGAYDLERLKRTRLIVIGTGGARSFVEDMIRAGVGELVLVDGDRVAVENIGTQQAYIDEIGCPKVEALAARVALINPQARISIYDCKLDEISDEAFWQIAFSPFIKASDQGAGTPAPQVTLLCGMTDDFFAQARVDRLALQYGLPSLCCQLYRGGRAGEISFCVPGVTKVCGRCMLVSRYRAYAAGYTNDVTSADSPIFATSRINALCGQIALAIIHAGTDHPRFGSMLSRISATPLVQLRLSPECGLSVCDSLCASADRARLIFDEPVWLEQTPLINCPHCGGTGDLLSARGKFTDTTHI